MAKTPAEKIRSPFLFWRAQKRKQAPGDELFLLLVTVLPQTLFPFVCGNLMPLSFFSARHSYAILSFTNGSSLHTYRGLLEPLSYDLLPLRPVPTGTRCLCVRVGEMRLAANVLPPSLFVPSG